jgi:hypothetical protein
MAGYGFFYANLLSAFVDMLRRALALGSQPLAYDSALLVTATPQQYEVGASLRAQGRN